MITTIENINGKDYTVISEQFDSGQQCGQLPALPRYPRNDEATIRLLHLYRAHGIKVWMWFESEYYSIDCLEDGVKPEVTHATKECL